MEIRRDTSAWILQTWLSFAIAFFLCIVAVWNMPSATLDRAFLAVGMFYVLSATFTLSKTIRDNAQEKLDTPSWIIQVWLSFGIAVSLTGWGIFRMNVEYWHKWFVLGSCIFLLSAAFTLAKTMRDNHEADILNSK